MIEYNAETVWDKKGKPSTVRITKHGHIRFSVSAVKNLQIKEGDKLSFYIDPRDVGVIYFKQDPKGIPLIKNTTGVDGTNGLQLCCRPLALTLLKSFNLKESKTFDLTGEKTNHEKYGDLWVIVKEKMHVPMKWRKQSGNLS